MGNEYSQFNVNAISYILQATEDDLKYMIEVYHYLCLPKDYVMIIHEEHLNSILSRSNIHESDCEIFRQLFILRDISGYGEASFKEILICFSILLNIPLVERLNVAFTFHAQGRKQTSKSEYVALMKLLNNCCYYFGDKKLPDVQIVNLVDSIYTMIGEIDGNVDYEDFYKLLLQHPLLELFTSLQFQGQDNYYPHHYKNN